ncbi:MAG: sigma-70 family RNA polymerase sigma factor [Selenomonas sp.]
MDEDKKEAMETTECMLLAAAQAGDSAAMMQLVEQYEPLLRRAAGQPHLLTLREDALAEGYVSFVRAVHDYDAASGVPFAGFVKARVYGDLRTLFRRTCKVWQREAAVDERREEPFWELIEDPAATAAMTRLERQAVLVPALRALTPREREVVQLLYLGERTQKETAAALGITQQAVAAAKRRALAKMRQVLKSIHE